MRFTTFGKLHLRDYQWNVDFSIDYSLSITSEPTKQIQNVTHLLITVRDGTCACQGVRNASFSENFAYLIDDP